MGNGNIQQKVEIVIWVILDTYLMESGKSNNQEMTETAHV